MPAGPPVDTMGYRGVRLSSFWSCLWLRVTRVLDRHQVQHLKDRYLLDVADVAHGLELFEVAGVVGKVDHEVLSVSDLELLDVL